MARKNCKVEGCTNGAIQGGVCIRHGAIVPNCKAEGCTNRAYQRGVCQRHGAPKLQCNTEGCTNQRPCQRHGTPKLVCKIEGCTNGRVQGGVCARHGARRPECKTEGCTNQRVQGGVCIRHGARRNTQSKKRKSPDPEPDPDPEPETPFLCLPVGMGAVLLNEFRGGGKNDSTPKVGDGNDVSPGQSSPRRSQRISNQQQKQQNIGQDSNRQQIIAQDSNRQQNNSRLQMPSMESPAPRNSALQMNRGQNRSVATDSEWLSRTQDENDIGEVDRFSFDCGGTVTAQGSGVYWLKEDREGQPLEYAIVGSITNGSYADEHTNLQVGKTLIFICTCQ